MKGLLDVPKPHAASRERLQAQGRLVRSMGILTSFALRDRKLPKTCMRAYRFVLILKNSTNPTLFRWFGTCTDIHELVLAREEAKVTQSSSPFDKQLANICLANPSPTWACNRAWPSNSLGHRSRL